MSKEELTIRDCMKRKMKTIFELELIRIRNYRYPIKKTWSHLIGLYTTLEKTEKAMLNVVNNWETDKYKDTFCFIITERKQNPKINDDDIVAVRTYYPNGEFYEENLVSRDGVFRGRPVERIKFKVGDIVEIYYGDIVELAIIGGTPPTVEFAEHHSYSMDRFDDQYLIYDTQPGGHNHIQSQYIFPTNKPVSDKLHKKLREQMLKGG